MSLKIAIRFAARELRGGLVGFRVFLACLALGVAAIAAVGTVRAGIEAGLEKKVQPCLVATPKWNSPTGLPVMPS